MKQFDVRQFSSDKILKHLDRVNEWLKGGNPTPITVELDLTNLCNHRCPECVVNYFRAADNNSMPFKSAQSIIGQLAKNKIRGLIFTGGGEPLCNPCALKAVELARSKGLDIGFITNGSLINEKAARIITKNCTWVRVSLDAGTPEVFKLTHGRDGNEFNTIVDKIKLLVNVKNKIKSSCTIGLGFLTCEHSVADMIKATVLAKKLGVNYLQFRPMQIHRGGRFEYHWADVENKILECLEYSGNGFQVLYSQHKYEMAKDPQFGRHYGKCYGQQFATVISASAKMYICCHTRGYKKYCIGDLTKETFKKIWDSRRRKLAIGRIDFRDCIPLCRDNTFNQILWNIKQPKEHLNFL
ncbi:MAG: radical SAM protein [Candidatus Omnitrophica bacterium]|nr:radical SAM protein [Candidatus Omnitrophota bacterium]